MNNHEVNLMILKEMQTYFEHYPEHRFVQGLVNMGIIYGNDHYANESSIQTFEILKDYLPIWIRDSK